MTLPALAVLGLALVLPLAACEGVGVRAAGGDPALDALRACVESSPHEICSRPTVEGDAGTVVVDSAYWADALGSRPDVFYDAAETCTRASLTSLSVGMARGTARADGDLAQAKLAGTVPEDAQLDPGVCYDVYLVYSKAGSEHENLGGRLEPPELARLATEARSARDRRNMELFRQRPHRSVDSLF